MFLKSNRNYQLITNLYYVKGTICIIVYKQYYHWNGPKYQYYLIDDCKTTFKV